MHDPRKIANWFIAKANDENHMLSLINLMHMIYLAHAWHLETLKTPLINSKIEAWGTGAIIPHVYHGYKDQGIYVTKTMPADDFYPGRRTLNILEYIYTHYGKMEQWRLTAEIKKSGDPWQIVKSRYGTFAPICANVIRIIFEKKREKSMV